MSGRILYHFTTANAIDRIRREGIHLGALPWHVDAKGEPCLIRHPNERGWPAHLIQRRRQLERMGSVPRAPGYQWLTENASFLQSWAFYGATGAPKNAYRVTVLVPEKVAEKRLSKWKTLCDRYRPDYADAVNVPAFDWENWWVHYGPIPPVAFIEIERNSDLIIPNESDPT